MPYYKYPFSPFIMSYGINPLNLYRLYQAMLEQNEVELKKVLEDTDKGFKIFWTIRIKKQDEAIQEEEAKQEEQAIREEQAKQEQSEVRAHNKGGKQKKKGKKSHQTKRRKSKKRPIVKRRKTQKRMRR